MSILVQTTIESRVDSSPGCADLAVTFLDEHNRVAFGTAEFTVYPFARTIESFGRWSHFAHLLEDENPDEARMLYYDPDVRGSGTLDFLDVPTDRIGEALLALRRSFFGRMATITATDLDRIEGADTTDVEAGLRLAGFSRFEESDVWLTCTAAPEG